MVCTMQLSSFHSLCDTKSFGLQRRCTRGRLNKGSEDGAPEVQAKRVQVQHEPCLTRQFNLNWATNRFMTTSSHHRLMRLHQRERILDIFGNACMKNGCAHHDMTHKPGRYSKK